MPLTQQLALGARRRLGQLIRTDARNVEEDGSGNWPGGRLILPDQTYRSTIRTVATTATPAAVAGGLFPVASCDEARPVERMRALMRRPAVTQHGEARLLHGLCGVQLLLQAAFLQRSHPVACGLVFDLPQPHDDSVHARDLKCASQAENAFSHRDY